MRIMGLVRIADCSGQHYSADEGEMPDWLNEGAQVVYYGGIRLATNDGRVFYPCIQSRWLNQSTGIQRKLLLTEPYAGISWKRLYIGLDQPDRVMQLLEVWPNQARLYCDEQGGRWVQQDLDGVLQRVTNEAWLADFRQQCDRRLAEEGRRRDQRYRYKVMNVGEQLPDGAFPPGAVLTELEGDLCCVEYVAQGESKMCWLDRLTGFVHTQRPVLLKRGCACLLREGNRVFIRNIRAEAGVPHRNWEVRADERVCTVGQRLYFTHRLQEEGYRLVGKSEDFRRFVLQEPGFDPRCGREPVNQVFMNDEK